MKDFFEIASGSRFRKNRLLESLTREARARYEEIANKGERALPLALISVAPEMTAMAVKVNVLGPKPADEALLDLTRFFAWLLPEQACRRAGFESFASDNRTTLDEMHTQRELVFPLSDPVRAAIEKLDGRMYFHMSEDFGSQWHVPIRWDIVNGLLSRLPVRSLFPDRYDEALKYGNALDRAVIFGLEMFPDFFTALRSDPNLYR